MTEDNRESHRRKLAAIMQDKLLLKLPAELGDSLRINEDLRIDSIMVLQLIVHIERELRLSVPEEEVDAKAFATIGSLLDFILKLPPLDPSGESAQEEAACP